MHHTVSNVWTTIKRLLFAQLLKPLLYFYNYHHLVCGVFSEADVYIDVEGDEEPRRPPYDTTKARAVMTECDRHVNLARSVEVAEEDWEDRITKWVCFKHTVDSRYYDTDGIRKMYKYNQTIHITSLNFYCLGMVGIQIWYHNKQYFVITDTVITRVYCNMLGSLLWYCWNNGDVSVYPDYHYQYNNKLVP
jgi:hypothetical protein